MENLITAQLNAKEEYRRYLDEMLALGHLVEKTDSWSRFNISGKEYLIKVVELPEGQVVCINGLTIFEPNLDVRDVLAMAIQSERSDKVVHSSTYELTPVIAKLDSLLNRDVNLRIQSNLKDEGMVNGHWGTSASGILFKCGEEILLLKRASWTKDPGMWGIPGGAIPIDEQGNKIDSYQSALNECKEEIGLVNLDIEQDNHTIFRDNGFTYTTYLIELDEKFNPVLNNEHEEFKWVTLLDVESMSDVHPGVLFALKEFGLIDVVKASSDEEIEDSLPAKFARAILNWEYGNLMELGVGYKKVSNLTLYRGVKTDTIDFKNGTYDHPEWQMWAKTKDVAGIFADPGGYILKINYTGNLVDVDEVAAKVKEVYEADKKAYQGLHFSVAEALNVIYEEEKGSVILPPNDYKIVKQEPHLLTVEASSVEASKDSLKNKFIELMEDEDFYEDEYMDFFEGSEGQDREHFELGCNNFKRKLKSWKYYGDKVKAWRAINVKDPSKINLTNLGNAWTFTREYAQSYYNGTGNTFIVEALIPENAIDLEVTLRQNIVNGEEDEIRTLAFSEIEIIAILDGKFKAVQTFKPPLEGSTGAVGVAGDWVASSMQVATLVEAATGPFQKLILDSIPWEDNYYDLYPGYSKKKNFDKEYYFDSKESALVEARDLSSMFAAMPNPIPVFRAIHAKKEEDIDLEHPGWSWSWSERSARSFVANTGTPKPWVLLKGFAPKKDVDWHDTVKLYYQFSGSSDGESENEIRIQGNKVKNLTWEWFTEINPKGKKVAASIDPLGTQKTSAEIYKYILDITKAPIPTNSDLEERVTKFALYELKEVPVEDLHLGWYATDIKWTRKITLEDIEGKPIVINEHGTPIDGNHRAEKAKALGLEMIKAWVPVLSSRTREDEPRGYQKKATSSKKGPHLLTVEGSVIESRTTSTDFKTATLYRGLKDISILSNNPLYSGTGYFGEGTYYALSAKSARRYATGDDFSWLVKYEFNFKNPLVISSPEDMELDFVAGGDSEIDIYNKKLKWMFGEDDVLKSRDLAEAVRFKGYDAIYLLGDVDGGEQVLIPKGANPTLKLLSVSLLLEKDKTTLINKIENILGYPAVQDPQLSLYVVFQNIPKNELEKIEKIFKKDLITVTSKEESLTTEVITNKGLKLTLTAEEWGGGIPKDKFDPELHAFKITAYQGKKEVGYVCCYHGGGRLYAFEVSVKKPYRRKGVATKMYNWAQEISNKHIYPHAHSPDNEDPVTSDDGIAFWKSRGLDLSEDEEVASSLVVSKEVSRWEQSYINDGFKIQKSKISGITFYARVTKTKHWIPKEATDLAVNVNEFTPDRVRGDVLNIAVIALDVPNEQVVGNAYFEGYPSVYGDVVAAKEVAVEDTYQQKGIGTNMYQIVKDLGYKVIPSSQRTDKGKKLWESLRRQGVAKVEATERKTKMYQSEYPAYQFEKEVHTDIQLTERGTEKGLKDYGEYRTGHAYGNLPMRANLYLERYGVPDWIYKIVSIYPRKGTIHAVYCQRGKDLIQIWHRVNILSEYPWKTFEAQAHGLGYKIKHMHKGVLEDSHGYWLGHPEFLKEPVEGSVVKNASANKPTLKKADMESAWEVVKHLCGVSDDEIESDEDQERLEEVYVKWSTAGKKLQKVPLDFAFENFKVQDHDRRIKPSQLNNPIIVGDLGKQEYIVLDGNHRLLTFAEQENPPDKIWVYLIDFKWAKDYDADAVDGFYIAEGSLRQSSSSVESLYTPDEGRKGFYKTESKALKGLQKVLLDAIYKVAKDYHFENPEKAYFNCTDFSIAAHKIAGELGVPSEILSAKVKVKKDIGELNAGDILGHSYLKIAGNYYDFTASQIDPKLPFPVVSTKPIWDKRGISIRIQDYDPTGWRFWFEKIKEALKDKTYSSVESFSNWVPLTPEQIKQEYEWEYKNQTIHSYGDIFPTLEDFAETISKAKVMTLTEEKASEVGNRSYCETIEELKELTSRYRFPRDVDRIVNGYETNAPMPYPILLDDSGDLEVMSGNTRLNAAYILGITPKVLVLKVPKN